MKKLLWISLTTLLILHIITLSNNKNKTFTTLHHSSITYLELRTPSPMSDHERGEVKKTWQEKEVVRPAAVSHRPRTKRVRSPYVRGRVISGDVWYALAGCETGYKYDNPNTGNGYYGYFQFDLSTWRSVGGPGYPHHHSYEVQKQFAIKLQQRAGWRPWPRCARKLGLL